MFTIIWGLYFALVLYNIVDIVQTQMLLSLGAHEANFLLAFFMGIMGNVVGMILVKSILLLLLGVLLFIRMRKEQHPEEFKMSDKDFDKIIDSLDETAGFLIKESELRYWIEYFVNKDRNEHPSIS